MTYAKGTSVAVSKSRAELEAVVTRYGATAFGSYVQGAKAMILFEHKARRVAFVLELPDPDAFRTKPYRGYRTACTPEEKVARWEQACRERWRSLVLVVKAKLEAVAAGITTFEDEFAMHFVLPDGSRLRDKILPRLGEVLDGHPLPPPLPGLPAPDEARS